MSEIVRVENLVFRYDDEIITKHGVDDVSLN